MDDVERYPDVTENLYEQEQSTNLWNPLGKESVELISDNDGWCIH